jgi:hypothetical protein
MSRAERTRNIIKGYQHDVETEGETITKRRLWYILKPKLKDLWDDKAMFKKNGNAEFNNTFNQLAEKGLIDDTYIEDNSRTMQLGSHYPHIIIATEKDTITPVAKEIANVCGFSLYVSGGQSSIYGAKKLLKMIGRSVVVLSLTDYDPHGFSISDTLSIHFNTNSIIRLLINPDQVPADRIEDTFNYCDKYGGHYELDVLNIHQLKDTFVDGMGEMYEKHLGEMVKAKIKGETLHGIKIAEVNNKPDVIALQKQLDDLKEKYYADSKTEIEFTNYTLSNALHHKVEYNII